MDLAREDAFFVALPKICIEKVRMVAHEDLTNRRIAQQEGAEGLWEYILGPHGIPNLA